MKKLLILHRIHPLYSHLSDTGNGWRDTYVSSFKEFKEGGKIIGLYWLMNSSEANLHISKSSQSGNSEKAVTIIFGKKKSRWYIQEYDVTK